MTSLGPKIENFREDKHKPNYLNVVMASEDDDNDNFDYDEDNNDEAIETEDQDSTAFYIYTGVGSQSVVFKRKYNDLAHVHGDEKTQKQQIEDARVQNA